MPKYPVSKHSTKGKSGSPWRLGVPGLNVKHRLPLHHCPRCERAQPVMHCGYNIVECTQCKKRWDLEEVSEDKSVEDME